jgi:hypothetical protein
MNNFNLIFDGFENTFHSINLSTFALSSRTLNWVPTRATFHGGNTMSTYSHNKILSLSSSLCDLMPLKSYQYANYDAVQFWV